MTPFARALPMMLYRTLGAVLPEFRAVFARFDLTEPQWRVLRVLWEQDGTPVAELAVMTLISAPSLVGVIDRLQRAGLVERRPSARDRRQVHVHLTNRGRALERRVRPLVEAAYARLQNALTAAEWRGLYESLDRLCDALEPTSPSTAKPRRAAVAARRPATQPRRRAS
jgi:homoprotocatechuate degradation regulator HpaR